MGTRMAPSYANLFMAQLEGRLLENANMKPLIWWRYIDDIFTIWCHGEASLKTFVEDLNQAHPTIKFTAEWSRSSIPFLDTRVLLENGQLTTDLHVKPTDTHQYLVANSCHPRHCKEAIPFSQALRMRRICSTNGDLKKRSLELKSHLLHRGYKSSFVQDEIDRASHIRREDALTPRTRTCHNKRVPLVVTYHPNLPNLTALTKNNLPVLHASSLLKKAIPEWPLIAYRRPKNLRDLLVKAELKPAGLQPAGGSSPCGTRRCLTCSHIQTGITFRSATTNQAFNVRATATCKTRNVIYLIDCRKCRKQYVGETQNPLHIRLNGHRNDIAHKRTEKPVASHFNSPGHSLDDLRIAVLEVMRSFDESLRRRRESYWIKQLRSLHPGGMNLDA